MKAPLRDILTTSHLNFTSTSSFCRGQLATSNKMSTITRTWRNLRKIGLKVIDTVLV